MNLKRPLFGPQDPRGPSHGRDVKDFVKRTLNRLPAQIPVGENFFPKKPGGWDDVYNLKVAQCVKVVQGYNDIEPTGNMGQATLDALWAYADPYSRWVYRIWSAPSSVPKLGPMVDGGVALSSLRPTHASSGFPNAGHPDSYFAAIDAGWIVGLDVLAVEDLTVTENSSANVGDACYAMGASTIEWWYAHLVIAPGVGSTFRKGDKVGDIVVHPNGAHVHLGMNPRRLIGHDFTYGYGLGVPTVGEQLKAALN